MTAIEQRDPTTSGHSLRVATYTQGLAEIVDRVSSGPYRGSHFDAEQMKEIRYAALLHDFGKVGVREEVLNAFFLQGNAAAIVAIARGEKDPELKKIAVQKLSIMNSKEGTDYLMEILQK